MQEVEEEERGGGGGDGFTVLWLQQMQQIMQETLQPIHDDQLFYLRVELERQWAL